MYVNKLKLINFRNYKELEINFDNNINIFYGNNAQGKTNILEALYFTATGRSHRTSRDKDLVNWESDEGYIGTFVKKENKETRIDIKIGDIKIIKVNEIPIKKLGELMGNLNAVIFSPEDLKILKEGPVERRRFIDIAISQIRPNYFYNLQQYFKVIHNRNTLLRDIRKNRKLLDTLFIWDDKVVEIGALIVYYRNVYLNKIESYLKNIHKRISDEEIKIAYIPSEKDIDLNDIESIKSAISTKLKQNTEKDIIHGTTCTGPHRDDFDVYINEVSAKIFGSQGQQRTAVLSLKLSEMELFKEELGEDPILLLDDVMSELDDMRQQYLLDNLESTQVFITCTNADKYIGKGKLFKVFGGKVLSDGVWFMFLHLGGDTAISMKDVIAIIDISQKNKAKITQEFLKVADEEGFIEKISDEQPKTFIIAEIDKKSKVFLSPISSVTLLKRAGFVEDISNV